MIGRQCVLFGYGFANCFVLKISCHSVCSHVACLFSNLAGNPEALCNLEHLVFFFLLTCCFKLSSFLNLTLQQAHVTLLSGLFALDVQCLFSLNSSSSSNTKSAGSSPSPLATTSSRICSITFQNRSSVILFLSPRFSY